MAEITPEKKIRMKLTEKECELLIVLRKAWANKKRVIVNCDQTAEELSEKNYKIIDYMRHKVPFGSFQITTHSGEGVRISDPRIVEYL